LSSSFFDGRLSWSGALPLHWRILDRLPDHDQLARSDERNTALLNALTLIEEQTGRQPEESSPLAAQIERLEAKFDLVLTLLTELLLPEHTAPGPVAMRLSSLGLAFDAGEPIPAGTVMELSIHFSASLPRPVVLYGVVVEPPAGEEGRVALEFRRLGPGVSERLERLVFRRHRRSIAQQKPALAL
jgi:hypothetical protein